MVVEGVVCYLLGLEPLSELDLLQRSKEQAVCEEYINDNKCFLFTIVTPVLEDLLEDLKVSCY